MPPPKFKFTVPSHELANAREELHRLQKALNDEQDEKIQSQYRTELVTVAARVKSLSQHHFAAQNVVYGGQIRKAVEELNVTAKGYRTASQEAKAQAAAAAEQAAKAAADAKQSEETDARVQAVVTDALARMNPKSAVMLERQVLLRNAARRLLTPPRVSPPVQLAPMPRSRSSSRPITRAPASVVQYPGVGRRGHRRMDTVAFGPVDADRSSHSGSGRSSEEQSMISRSSSYDSSSYAAPPAIKVMEPSPSADPRAYPYETYGGYGAARGAASTTHLPTSPWQHESVPTFIPPAPSRHQAGAHQDASRKPHGSHTLMPPPSQAPAGSGSYNAGGSGYAPSGGRYADPGAAHPTSGQAPPSGSPQHRTHSSSSKQSSKSSDKYERRR
ncbi:hypothetical protein HDZ31DRAFT_76338 [Schizophyllum fasciatum]